VTTLTLDPDSYANPSGATHLRIYQTDKNGALFHWPIFNSPSLINWQCVRVPIDGEGLTGPDGFGFSFPNGHGITGPVSGYYTIEITNGFSFTPPSNGSHYHIQSSYFDTYISTTQASLYGNAPHVCIILGNPTSFSVSSDLTYVPVDNLNFWFKTACSGFNISGAGDHIEFAPPQPTDVIFRVTLDIRMFGDVANQRLFAALAREPSAGGGFSQEGRPVLNYNRVETTFSETQSSRSFITSLGPGDKLRLEVARGNGSTVESITIEEAIITITMASVPT
jgi:hypothetical protein